MHAATDRGLAVRVERGGRLVQDEQLRGVDEGAGDRDALALAAGQAGAALADARLHPLRQRANEIPRLRGAECGFHVSGGQSGVAQRDVREHAFVEQQHLLRHVADRVSPRLKIDGGQGNAVDMDAAAIGL